jgi:hypothetical protein
MLPSSTLNKIHCSCEFGILENSIEFRDGKWIFGSLYFIFCCIPGFCFVLFCFVFIPVIISFLFFRAQHNPHAVVVVTRVLRCSLHSSRHLQLRHQNSISAPKWRQSCAWQTHTPHRPSPAEAPLHYPLRSNSHPHMHKLSLKIQH